MNAWWRKCLAALFGCLLALDSTAQTIDHSGHAGHAAEVEQERPVAPGHAHHQDPEPTPAGGSGQGKELRDPHAWSDGLQRGRGPFTDAGVAPLHLHDEHAFWRWRADRLEWVEGHDSQLVLEGLVDYGRTYRGWRLRPEAEFSDGSLEDYQVDLVHRRALAPYWDLQAGLRHERHADASRSWLGVGLAGLAPYWFELDLSVWLGESGRTALNMEADYEWLLSQQWILAPGIEVDAYGDDDPAAGLGSGLAEVAAGLRLRYEVTRQVAPYIGWEWEGQFGETADLARAAGIPRRDSRWLIGLRLWY